MSNIKENLGRFINSKPTQIISSALLSLGTGADILSQSHYRNFMPRIIGTHAGNFGLSALPIVATGIISSLIQENGKLTNRPKLESFGKNLYTWSIIFMLGVEAGVEGQFVNRLALLKENAGDFSMGIIAMALAMLAISRFRNKHNKNKILDNK